MLSIEELARKHCPDHVVVRASNVYGPGQLPRRGQGVIAHWVKAILDGEPIQLIGDPATRRDYIYITDLADALVRCTDAIAPPQLVNYRLRHRDITQGAAQPDRASGRAHVIGTQEPSPRLRRSQRPGWTFRAPGKLSVGRPRFHLPKDWPTRWRPSPRSSEAGSGLRSPLTQNASATMASPGQHVSAQRR